MSAALLTFDRGTLLLEGIDRQLVPAAFRFDDRVGMWRAPAQAYHDVVLALHNSGTPYRDEARAYDRLDRDWSSARTPRDYQREATDAWHAGGRRGVVVLPTGAGKSFVAELCIAEANRHALVVAPTLDLVSQWYDTLVRGFGEPIGVLGGGIREVADLTVATYDSAHLYAERYGNRFGLLVFDEVHHLPGPSYRLSAASSLAPWRLGLTATLEGSDGAPADVGDLVGPVLYRRTVTELAGEFLAEYRTEVVTVDLSDEEREAYDDAVDHYRAFREDKGLTGGRGGFQQFLREAGRSKAGRQALAAFRTSRRILQRTPRKLAMLSEILVRHAKGRALVFTSDNATAYRVSRSLLLPVITHQTDPKERRALLTAFGDGTLPTLVTSRVLNEGVDLPEADVAVILSGTGTVREHVQRLGRILRKREGKQAILYELVVADSAEEYTSRRRRDHEAYQR
ncbi:MAG: DEAD/DEAH box helicase family protein [Myxococcales bacterium]|nr:DEAD/DEAH box helicase family protein [Myxococcales bacterium]